MSGKWSALSDRQRGYVQGVVLAAIFGFAGHFLGATPQQVFAGLALGALLVVLFP
jgi:hypothetical protein